MNPIYGQMAQTVAPNSKCESCLHYNSQRGPTGVCEIGLRPATCGDGDMPSIGYAPVHSIGPSSPGTHAPVGQAPMQPGKMLVPSSALYRRYGVDNGPVPMAIVCLGEEHAEMVKSIVRENTTLCHSHSRGSSATPAVNAMLSMRQPGCACRTPSDFAVRKSFEKRLNNFQRVALQDHQDDYLQAFVSAVRNGEDYQKSLNEAAIDKGFYGDDWLSQFKGTELFDDAHKLCEEELELAEADLKARIARNKAQKERAAHLAKLQTPTDDYSWDEKYQKDDALRIKKQRLLLKLAKVQQKMVTAPKMTKSDDDDDDLVKAMKPGMSVSQQAVESTHRVHSTGGITPQQKSARHSAASRMHSAAAKIHKQLGNTEVASAHRRMARSHAAMAAAPARGPNLGRAKDSKAHSEVHQANMPTIQNHLSKR